MTISQVDEALSNDLNTPRVLDIAFSISEAKGYASDRLEAIYECDKVLGLNLATLSRDDLRIRPITATMTEPEIEAALAARKEARAAKDFARSDALREELAAQGVEVMDGDPLGWDWELEIAQ